MLETCHHSVSTLGGKIYDYIFFPFPWTSYHSYPTWHCLYPPLRHQLRIRALNFPLHDLFTSILPGLILEICTLEKWGVYGSIGGRWGERHKPLSHYTLPTSRPHTTKWPAFQIENYLGPKTTKVCSLLFWHVVSLAFETTKLGRVHFLSLWDYKSL